MHQAAPGAKCMVNNSNNHKSNLEPAVVIEI